MEEKFFVKVYLVIVAVEPDPAKKDESKFLVVNEGSDTVFPNKNLTSKNTTKDIAINLLAEYTGVTKDWAVIFPFGIVDDINQNKDSVAVLYGVFIPGVTRIRVENSRWENYNVLISDAGIPALTKKLAYEAIWRQV